jgi:hypothetical protein
MAKFMLIEAAGAGCGRLDPVPVMAGLVVI